ncbi:hypothetical protein [Paenibacillus sp. cl141a]|uniref:hypothetical protein n=1 Tax=Paenibacillus sp. cl141a TaxID=1761877 RepID=UPI001113ECC7|nr:hypothetical protein [Paenibacillus sp. cl141a]
MWRGQSLAKPLGRVVRGKPDNAAWRVVRGKPDNAAWRVVRGKPGKAAWVCGAVKFRQNRLGVRCGESLAMPLGVVRRKPGKAAWGVVR